MGPTGIRVGNIEIHPELSFKAGYDTNVFKADGEEEYNGVATSPQSKIESAGLLTLTPGLTLQTLGDFREMFGADAAGAKASSPPKLELKAAAFASFFQYVGLTNPVTGKEQNLRGAEFDVSGDFHILPKRPVSLMLGASWTRSARPFTASAGEEEDDMEDRGVKARKQQRKAQAFNTVVPRARLLFESRGGVLTAFTGYRPQVQPFEGEAFQYLSSATHDVDAGIGWRFFPSTALLYDLTLTIVDYYKLDEADPDRVQVLLSPSRRVRTRLGINGAFTSKLSLRVLAGYAVGLFDNRFLDEYELPVGEAVLTYKFGGERKSVADGGYQRNVSPAAVGGFMLQDRGFARLKFVLLRLFAMTAEGGVAYVQYGRQVAPNRTAAGDIDPNSVKPLHADGVTTERTDLRIDATLRAEYRVLSWLGVLADGTYQQNITDFRFGNDTVSPDPAKYQAFQVSAGLRASY
jgi:hypothetical protein